MEGCGCLWQTNTCARILTFTYLVTGGLLLLVSAASTTANVSTTATTTKLNQLVTQLTTLQPLLETPSSGDKDTGNTNNGKKNTRKKTPSRLPPLKFTWRDGKVCRAIQAEDRTFKIGNKVEKMRAIENCSVIEGNVEIKWMYSHVSPNNYTGVKFPKLVEITGYLLLYRVNGLHTLGQLFPNLRVIRANEVFMDYGLILYENEDLMSISLPKLSYIGSHVVAMMNPQLCYVDDYVNWKYITPGNSQPSTTHNKDRRNCALVDGCPEVNKQEICSNCWDMDTCQLVCNCRSEDGHNPGCDAQGSCCHEDCLGGCTTTGSPWGCYACKNVYHEGKCIAKCPETNADGEELLELEGRHCITRQECIRDHMYNVFHDGKCLNQCPPQWVADKALSNVTFADLSVHGCEKCSGICDIVCGYGTIQTASESAKFKGCTVIQGFLEIVISNTPGDLDLLYDNLQYITEVTDYVKIVRSQYIKDLGFLKRLKHIGGAGLDSGQYAFYVMDNENLENIWDLDSHPTLTIQKGMVFFQQNPQLCYSHIETFVDTIMFKGKHELANGTVVPITNATHDEFDISDTTNGQYGNCFNNSLFFEIYYKMDFFPMYNFSAFNTTDDRLVISYVLYYRKVNDGENATYMRRTCDSENIEWTTEEIEKTESSDGYYTSFMPKILAFTRYAAYVQTFTTKTVGLDGARSKIIYFTTKPSKPDRPRELLVTPLDIEMDNIGLEVSWLPPESPNGILENYNIYYKKLPWNVEHLRRKDHCTHGVNGEEYEEEDEASQEEINRGTTPAAATNGTCDCVTETASSNPVDVLRLQKKKEMADLRYNFENYLQNKVFEKNPSKTKSGGGQSRRKRGIANSLVEEDLVADDTPTTTILSTISSLTTTPTTTTSTTSVPSQSSTITIQETPTPSMASVKANTTTVPLYNLEPNTLYSIEVVACHGFDKSKRETRCSKRAMATTTTKSDPTLDVIDSDTFMVMEVKSADGEVKSLNFTWKPPERTNGPILTYTIGFQSADNVDDVDDNGENRTDSTSAEQIRCVQAQDFEKENNTFVMDTAGTFIPGTTYEFRVRMRTVGTLVGEYTSPKLLKVGESRAEGTTEVLTKVLLPCLAVVVISIVVVFFVYRHKKRKPLPPTTLHNSFNIDYMDTENMYIPDEWELDRAKVKIGVSLGQGSFGMVYEGEAKDLYNTDKKSRKVAIKTVNDGATIQDRINFLNEASRMKAFSCNHIVQLLGVVSQGQPALVIMELMALGDLKNYLRMHRPDEPDNDGRRPPTLREILQMAAEIADGMAYLADRKFVHRDLAARNCMVAHDMTVKIGDFGMTRDVYGADYYRKGGKAMLPVRWMAPESLRDGVYTSKSDVWSYGVVIWEMATLAAQPYQGFSNEEVLKFVMDNRIMEMPDGCPTRLFEIMSQCWQFYPRYRPSFAALLESLQGEVKKTFFSVSWYYSQRDDEESDMESDSLNIDERHSESQPLRPASIRSSSCSLNMAADHDLPDSDLESNNSKVMIDLAPPLPTRMNQRAVSNCYEMEPTTFDNAPLTGSEYEETGDEYDSLCASPILTNGLSHSNCESRSKGPSSVVSSVDQAPPSYNTATQNPCVNGEPLWTSDIGSKGNSCNGSANGHIHYGNNTLTTSAC